MAIVGSVLMPLVQEKVIDATSAAFYFIWALSSQRIEDAFGYRDFECALVRRQVLA